MQQGGRVYNLSGCHNKADYLPEIRKWVAKNRSAPVLIVLGDNKNDIEMLNRPMFPVRFLIKMVPA